MVGYPIYSSSSTTACTWLVKMLGYYYPVICTIIKTLATIDETMHSVVKIGDVAACSLGIWGAGWGGPEFGIQ